METTQCRSLTQQRLQAQQGIKHKCGWASALQIQSKVWHLNHAIPQLGMHFDKHVSHGHKPFSNFLDDPLFRRTCSPMPLLLNIPPFSSSDCSMHFVMPTDFTCCTLLMLAGPPWRVWTHTQHLQRFPVTSLILFQKEKRPIPKTHIRIFTNLLKEASISL